VQMSVSECVYVCECVSASVCTCVFEAEVLCSRVRELL
jgi:hypothetical protein